MKPDDTVCFCFHVSLRKIENFCEREQPGAASQISECLGAGTGCGWCVPLLRKIHQRLCGEQAPWWRKLKEEADKTGADDPVGQLGTETELSEEEHQAGRERYLQKKKARNVPPPPDENAGTESTT